MYPSSLVYRATGGRDYRSLLLIVSVAVNLIFVGLILSWEMGGMASQSPVHTQEKAIPLLSQADATVVRNAIEQYRTFEQRDDQLFPPIYAKIVAMLKGPFDRAAFDDLLMKLSATINDHTNEGHRIFADEMAALSPEGRAVLAARYEEEGRTKSPRKY